MRIAAMKLSFNTSEKSFFFNTKYYFTKEQSRKRQQSSELLQEAQHQVPQGGAQRLVVADDVRPVLLQLDQRVLRLQVEDVSVRRLLHFDLVDAVLQARDSTFKMFNHTEQ